MAHIVLNKKKIGRIVAYYSLAVPIDNSCFQNGIRRMTYASLLKKKIWKMLAFYRFVITKGFECN